MVRCVGDEQMLKNRLELVGQEKKVAIQGGKSGQKRGARRCWSFVNAVKGGDWSGLAGTNHWLTNCS